MEQRYTYNGDPDNQTIYEFVSASKGAGPLRNQEFITYQCMKTGQHYTRTKEDFEERMTLWTRDVVY